MTILLTLLTVLFYAGLAYLLVILFFYFFERIFGPMDGKIKQIILALVPLACVIWIISVLALGTPVPAPWLKGR